MPAFSQMSILYDLLYIYIASAKAEFERILVKDDRIGCVSIELDMGYSRVAKTSQVRP